MTLRLLPPPLPPGEHGISLGENLVLCVTLVDSNGIRVDATDEDQHMAWLESAVDFCRGASKQELAELLRAFLNPVGLLATAVFMADRPESLGGQVAKKLKGVRDAASD